MITIFYDGKCGLCAREIAYYRKIAAAGIFEWQDITQSVVGLNKLGITLEEGLKSIHSIDDNGNIHRGVSTFILIWKQLKYWHILASVIDLPIIRPIAEFTYFLFARWRTRMPSYCQFNTKE